MTTTRYTFRRLTFLIAVLMLLACKNTALAFKPSSVVHNDIWIRQYEHSPIQRAGLPPRVAFSRSTRLNLINTPLISPSDTWGNYAALLGTATLAQLIGGNDDKNNIVSKIVSLLGPPVTAMAITFVLATVGVLPSGGTAASKSLQLLSLQLATPLVLLGADMSSIEKNSSNYAILGSFFLASAGTLLSCLLAWKVIGTRLSTVLPNSGLTIAAALMAKNIGGGINYIAVCQTLQAEPLAVAAGLCIDNIFALIYFPLTSILASRYNDIDTHTVNGGVEDVNADSDSASITVPVLSKTLSLAATLIWLGQKLGHKVLGALPMCTLLSVLAARFILGRKNSIDTASIRHASSLLGTLALYIFFATAGAPGIAVADSVRACMVPLGIFLTILYSGHGLFLYTCHKLRPKSAALQPQRLLVASSAAIGGPATAIALAQGAGWESLKVPSLLVGNVGYAIATFLGLAYHAYFS